MTCPTVIISKRLMHDEYRPGSRREGSRVILVRDVGIRHAIKKEAEQIVIFLNTAT